MIGQTNAKVVSGGNVEVLERGAWVEDESTLIASIQTLTPYLQRIHNRLKIDDTHFLEYTSTNPGGGSNTVAMYNSSTSQSALTSVSLYFGQSYTGYAYFCKTAKVSPNKELMIVGGVSSNTNIFAVPLIKNGNDYTFGSVVSLNVGTTPTLNVNCFIDDSKFVFGFGSSLNIYEYQNGAITLLKTITLSGTPQALRCYSGKLIISYSGQLDIIDYETEEVLYTENSAGGNSLSIYKNYLIYNSYSCLDLSTLTKLNITKSFTGYSLPIRQDDYYEIRDNVICFAGNRNTCFVVDLVQNKSYALPIKGKDTYDPGDSYTNYTWSNSFFINNSRLFYEYGYQSSAWAFFADLNEDLAIKIEYEDNNYVIDL